MSNIVIYTDGAYSPLRDQGGIGVVFVKDDKVLKSYSRMFKKVTNNKMELTAVLIALQTVLKNDMEGPITIISDSQYVINCATGRYRRSKNIRLWDRYDQIKQELDKKNITINFDWVRGHNGDKFNELADHLAAEASREMSLT